MEPSIQPGPATVVIFGAAGDLTWRKLVPALFDLSQDRSLPSQFAIIAVDRIRLGDDLKDLAWPPVLLRALRPLALCSSPGHLQSRGHHSSRPPFNRVVVAMERVRTRALGEVSKGSRTTDIPTTTPVEPV